MTGPPILVVTPTFTPEKVGTPHYIGDLVAALVERGQTVEVVCQQPYYPEFQRYPGYGRSRRHDQVHGATVHRLPTIVPRGGSFAWRAVSELNFLLQIALRRLLRRLPTSTRVIGVSPGAPFVVLAAALLTARRGRLVALIHDIQTGLFPDHGRLARLRPLAASIERRCLERADHLTVLSIGMSDELRRNGVTRPITVEPIWATVGATDAAEEQGTVLYSGNLGRKQGVGTLLDLAGRLRVSAPDARVVIRGQGSEREDVADGIRSRGLDNVALEDLVPVEQLADSLACAAVHVVPQLPTGATAAMPSKIYNILAVGRPLVAVAAPDSGIRDLAAQTGGIVCVPPDDLDALERAVVGLLHDDEQRRARGAEGAAYVRDHRSRAASAARYAALATHGDQPERGAVRSVPGAHRGPASG
ncbi:glycosyltransferase [Nitriliruptoraceae bacterium ZYF776]|nr:glycosyltransferase [Profundirhabdus halotolerans]